jgi:hypothetical protein
MNRGTYQFCRLALLALVTASLSSCSLQQASRQIDSLQDHKVEHKAGFQNPEGGGEDALCKSQKEVLEAQGAQARKVEVLFSARVARLLPDDTEGLPHQRFLLRLANGSTVLVAHDTKYAPHVPIQEGDRVSVKGEYIWNARGGVVHWTHHSDTFRHESGFIESGGKRYE